MFLPQQNVVNSLFFRIGSRRIIGCADECNLFTAAKGVIRNGFKAIRHMNDPQTSAVCKGTFSDALYAIGQNHLRNSCICESFTIKRPKLCRQNNLFVAMNDRDSCTRQLTLFSRHGDHRRANLPCRYQARCINGSAIRIARFKMEAVLCIHGIKHRFNLIFFARPNVDYRRNLEILQNGRYIVYGNQHRIGFIADTRGNRHRSARQCA